MNKRVFFALCLFAAMQCPAQVKMADQFRSEGKIYVVIAIILVILAGFFLFLIKLDRRTKRLEKRLSRNK